MKPAKGPEVAKLLYNFCIQNCHTCKVSCPRVRWRCLNASYRYGTTCCSGELVKTGNDSFVDENSLCQQHWKSSTSILLPYLNQQYCKTEFACPENVPLCLLPPFRLPVFPFSVSAEWLSNFKACFWRCEGLIFQTRMIVTLRDFSKG